MLDVLPSISQGDAVIAIVVATVVVFIVRMLNKLMQSAIVPPMSNPTIFTIEECFPSALTNEGLCQLIKSNLESHGFGSNSLLATSLCSDELNRSLEKDLASLYGHTFNMGGLSGFAFGGVTGFTSMASHIPDDGSCVIVYGPHVGIDEDGKVGTVSRRGLESGGTCCGSGIAAFEYVESVRLGKTKPKCAPIDPSDAQQNFVRNILLAYSDRLAVSTYPMAELPYVLYDAQDELMQRILDEASCKVAGEGKIAIIGGIQINTPAGMSDYFLPLRFDIINNTGTIIETFLHGIPRATVSKLRMTYPRALPNVDLVSRVASELSSFGYGKNSLLCTSLCCDEVNRPLENDFQAVFGDRFNIGGLSGFAFAGLTGFGAMTAHIPDKGSCLVVYGPHVGLDSSGHIGTVDRRGRANGGPCCGSAIAACSYVKNVMEGGPEMDEPTEPLDAQQAFVSKMLLAKGERLMKASDLLAELPLAMYEAQDEFMLGLIEVASKKLKNGSFVALLGGVQINTPEGMSDYFLPLRFEIRNNRNVVVADLMWY